MDRVAEPGHDGLVDPETYLEYIQLAMKSIATPIDITTELNKLNAKAAAKKEALLARGVSTENWPNAGHLVFRVQYSPRYITCTFLFSLKFFKLKFCDDGFSSSPKPLRVKKGFKNLSLFEFIPFV